MPVAFSFSAGRKGYSQQLQIPGGFDNLFFLGQSKDDQLIQSLTLQTFAYFRRIGMATVSFAADILPLFDAKTDIPHMAKGGVMLAEYSYMSVPANAQAVLERLGGTSGPVMPPPPASPWSAAQIALFKSWMAGGYQP
jgi:hypothetical protein